MTVNFFTVNRDGEHLLGRVTYEQGRLQFHDLPERLVRELELGIFVGRDRIMPKEEPARFFAGLPRAYAGTYMFARLSS